jgi:hypothetical protein
MSSPPSATSPSRHMGETPSSPQTYYYYNSAYPPSLPRLFRCSIPGEAARQGSPATRDCRETTPASATKTTQPRDKEVGGRRQAEGRLLVRSSPSLILLARSGASSPMDDNATSPRVAGGAPPVGVLGPDGVSRPVCFGSYCFSQVSPRAPFRLGSGGPE